HTETMFGPERENGGSAGTSLPLSLVSQALEPVFSDPDIRKIGQNIKYDSLVLRSHGIEVAGIAFDTMVANYILRPDAQHNLDSMAAEHLRYRMISYDDLTGTGKERKELRQIDVAKVGEYSAEDAHITFRLYDCLAGKLRSQGRDTLASEIEFPLIAVLADMESAGVALDPAYLHELSREMQTQLSKRTREIIDMAGEEFNLNSTQQLGKILFDKLKL